jgi:homoserine dehydrogenase
MFKNKGTAISNVMDISAKGLMYPNTVYPTNPKVKTKRVAVIGFGNIGSGVIELLLKKEYPELELCKIAVKHLDKKRPIFVPDGMMIDNFEGILNDSDIDIIVEVTGEKKIAKDIILRALRNGKDVVTANKAVIARYGQEIFREASKQGCKVGIRGTFVGCYPLVPELNARFQEKTIKNIVAILNGTTNFILSSMTKENMDFQTALRLAQQEGYAEPDPTEDVNGIDTANKIRILLGLTNNSVNVVTDIPHEGITEIETQDIIYSKELGYVFKLVGIISHKDENVFAGVFPVLVKVNSFLGSTSGANNAIEIEDNLNVVWGFIAPGAGKYPTAKAIIGDLSNIAKGIDIPIPKSEEAIILKDIADVASKFYLRLTVVDRPGVLAQISKILANYNISIAAVRQEEQIFAESVPLIILSHPTTGTNVASAVKEIDELPIVKEQTKIFRVFEATDAHQHFPLPS